MLAGPSPAGRRRGSAGDVRGRGRHELAESRGLESGRIRRQWPGLIRGKAVCDRGLWARDGSSSRKRILVIAEQRRNLQPEVRQPGGVRPHAGAGRRAASAQTAAAGPRGTCGRVDTLRILHRREIVRPVCLDDERVARQREGVEDEHLELHPVGLAGFTGRPSASMVGIFLSALCQGRPAVPAAIRLANSRSMMCMAMLPGRKRSPPADVGLALAFHGKVRVLDHEQPPVSHAEVAQFLLGILLGDHLARHLRAAVEMPAYELRIGAAHQRVVHLEVTEHVDSLGRSQVQGAAARQGPERAPVSVGRHRYRARSLEHDPSIAVHRGHPPLPEKMHPAWIEPEMPAFLEKGLGCGMIQVARHDEPMERAAVAPARGQQLFGKDLEQRLPPDRCHGKRSLGPIVSEAGALAPGHREGGHPPGPEGLPTGRPGGVPGRAVPAGFGTGLVGRRLQACEVGAGPHRDEQVLRRVVRSPPGLSPPPRPAGAPSAGASCRRRQRPGPGLRRGTLDHNMCLSASVAARTPRNGR